MTRQVQAAANGGAGAQITRRSSRSLPLFSKIQLIYVASLIMFVLLWQVGASMYASPAFFPSPADVVKAAKRLLVTGELFEHIFSSTYRIAAGFVIGSALAVPIGMWMGYNKYASAIFDPYTEFFRFVPAIAWLSPVVLWFGIGETSKILIIIYTTVFIVIINTAVGVKSIAKNKLRAAASLGASSAKTFIYVMWPATLPFILTGMRLAMGNSFATVVSAEMIAADNGLGFLIYNSRLWMATDDIFVGILCLGALGIIADQIFRIIIKYYTHHYANTA